MDDNKSFEEKMDELVKQKADLVNKYGYLHCLLDKLAIKMHEDIVHNKIMGYSEDYLDALAIEHVNNMNKVIADYVRKMNERNDANVTSSS